MILSALDRQNVASHLIQNMLSGAAQKFFLLKALASQTFYFATVDQ
jgi:hypothetical protein